jgi:hypothetical protein
MALFALFILTGAGAMARMPFALSHSLPQSAKTNAAQQKYGARFNLTTTKGGSRDPNTGPEATFDNNVHTRCVLRGEPPYTFTIELPFRIPVDTLAFAQSDYATERAPREVEITLDDGPVVRHTLELQRPSNRKPVWQEVPIGREARVIRVTVLSNHVPDPAVNWGGLGEIGVRTSANLDEKIAIPNWNANAPTFVHLSPAATQTAARVHLPPVVPLGQHPRLLLSRAEVGEMKAALQSSERGRTAYASLLSVADSAAKETPNFPDPKGPLGQLTDRGDAVARQHSRLSMNAGTLSLAYALTGERRYAERAADLLRGYAERYNAYPEHKGANKSDTGKVMAQRLSEAMWLIPLIEAYDYLYDSGVLTPDDKQRIETDLIRPAIGFIRRKEPKSEVAERDRADKDWRTAPPPRGGAANWLLYYNSATIMAGAVMNDRDMVDLAVADFRRLLANGIGADGMWLEGAIGYQFFALMALVPGMETAARLGIDLWGFDGSRVKRLFDSPLWYAYPDGTAPGINDSGRSRFGNWSTMAYDYAFLRYGDSTYAFLVNASPRQLHMTEAVYFPTRLYQALPEPKATTYPSLVFTNLGYAILRQPNLYALMDYGPHGGVHGHFDKLNLILFAAGPDGKGDEMGGEPVFHRYEDPLHGEWTTQTVAHNTMTVDGNSQIAGEGKLLVFEDTPLIKVMRAETATAVPGALMDRTVVVTPDAVLDLFHGRSSYRRTWDRTLRFQGKLDGLTDGPASATSPEGRDGYSRLQIVRERPAAEMWQGNWQTTVGGLAATVAGASEQQILLAQGPDKDHIALARQQGPQADFVAAYNLDAWSNPIQSLRRLPTGDPLVIAAEMTQRDGTLTTVFVSHKGGAWDAPALGWKSDARVLCIRRTKNHLQALLTGGTFAEGKSVTIRRSIPGNYLAEHKGGTLNILSEWTGPQ